MRIKSDAVDYHYFREPNIIQLDISHLIQQTQNQMSELPSVIKGKLLRANIPPDLVEQLLDNYDAYQVYTYINSQINDPVLTAA
jgi:Asp-tRNA(Asn)/Glu-tRNA(Gln) amidotransferase B subunit